MMQASGYKATQKKGHTPKDAAPNRTAYLNKKNEIAYCLEQIKNYQGAFSLQVKCVRLNFELRDWHYQQLSGLRDLMRTTMDEMKELLRLEELAKQRVSKLSGGRRHG